MILRPRSQQFIRNNSSNTRRYHLNSQNHQQNIKNYEAQRLNQRQVLMRKKISDFSFLPQDKIGRGYSSIVYKGLNDSTNQSVAIKVIQLKSLKDENSKHFLQNQLNCLKIMHHQNCLRYIDSYMTSNNCYIITQLYTQGDLSQILKKKKSLPQYQILTIFKQFLSGYKYFSSKGFIHRDLKPSNILISQKGCYVIADFGFIQHNYQNPKQNYNVGTPVYMAPESLTQNIYTLKSDIWSIGVMLYQMAFGTLPFKGRMQNDLKYQICNKELNFNWIQRETKIFLSNQFINLIDLCLKKNPYQRINLDQIQDHPWIDGRNVKQQNNTPIIIYEPVQNILIKNYVQKSQFNNINFRYSLPYTCQQKLQSKNNVKNGQSNNTQIKINNQNQNKQNLPPNKGIQDKFNQIQFLLQKSNKRSRQLLSNSKQLKLFSNSKEKLQVFKQKQNKSFKEIQKNNFKNKINQIASKKSEIFSSGYPNYKLKITQKKYCRQQIQAKLTLMQGMKSIVDLKKLKKNPIIQTSMHNLMDFQNQNKVNSAKNFNNIQNVGLMKFKSLQLNNTKDKFNTSLQKLEQLSPIEYMIRYIHLMRFIFQIFTNLNNCSASKVLQKNDLKQVRKIIFDYFMQDWEKIQNICYSRQNILKLQLEKWEMFTSGNKFAVFQDVVKQYKDKFINQQKFQQLLKQNQYIKKSKILVLIDLKTKFNDILRRFDQQISGLNCLNQCQKTKQQIKSIFNLLKLVQLTNQRNLLGEKVYLEKNNIKKMLGQLQRKQEAFKISKMIIQLKKKYYEIQSEIFIK